MTIYFLKFSVKPAERNLNYIKIEGANAFFWIQSYDSTSALAKAKFELSKYDWIIENIIDEPIEVRKQDFEDKDLGLESYLKAEKHGSSSAYVGWPKEGSKIVEGESFEIKSSQTFDLEQFLKKQKQLINKGRCLHFDKGSRCNSIIKAHSIQNSRMLSSLAREGKVYQVSKNLSDTKKNYGSMSFKQDGINKVSIFRGFCKHHDNELFEPIDNLALIPTSEQIFLYSYRSLCREFFVKENALHLLKSANDLNAYSPAYKDFLGGMLEGTQVGYDNLHRHKTMFDDSLKRKANGEIKYVVFKSDEKPFMAFSGVLYPHYDFMGNLLQDISNQDKPIDMITYSSAPTENGWAFIFAWHVNSSVNCVAFMRSLATQMYEGHDVADLLFRFIISSCENIAFSPQWWESLTKDQQQSISDKATTMADVLAITLPNYLQEGLTGISKWRIVNMVSNME